MKKFIKYKTGKNGGQHYHCKNRSAFSSRRPFMQSVAQPYEISLIESPIMREGKINKTEPLFHIRSGSEIEGWKEITGSREDFGEESRLNKVRGIETPKLELIAKSPEEAKRKYLREIKGEKALKNISLIPSILRE